MDLYDNALTAYRASRDTLVIAAGLELIEIVGEFFGQMEHFTTEGSLEGGDDWQAWRLSIVDISVEGWDTACGYDNEGRWEHTGWTPRKHYPLTMTEREAWEGLIEAAGDTLGILGELADDYRGRVRWSRRDRSFTFETKES